METETLNPNPKTLTPAIADVINSIRNSDVSNGEQTLLSWAQALKLELSSSFSDELLLKEVDKIELQVQVSKLEKENEGLKERVSELLVQEIVGKGELDVKISELEGEIEFLRKENVGLKEKVFYLKEIIEKGVKISQLEKELAVTQNENLGLRERVTNLSQTVEKSDFVIPTPKKKQRKRVVLSGSDNESDDNLPIGNLFNVKKYNFLPKNVGSCKRRLVRLSEMETPVKKRRRNRKLCFSDDESISIESPKRKYINLQKSSDEEVEEESNASESLSRFIVTGSEPESSNSNPNPSNSNSSDTDLDSDVALKEVLNKIKSKKRRINNNDDNKWEFEADMLAEFGKKPTTCLRAICALYKRQTEEEQRTKSTQDLNKIGFSQFDAERASLIADFLTDEKPWGPIVRTVEELEQYNKYGLQYCERIVMKYSKQLFEMYQENEDPYFGPSLSD